MCGECEWADKELKNPAFCMKIKNAARIPYECQW